MAGRVADTHLAPPEIDTETQGWQGRIRGSEYMPKLDAGKGGKVGMEGVRLDSRSVEMENTKGINSEMPVNPSKDGSAQFGQALKDGTMLLVSANEMKFRPHGQLFPVLTLVTLALVVTATATPPTIQIPR